MQTISLHKKFYNTDLAREFNRVCVDMWGKSGPESVVVSELTTELADAYGNYDGNRALKEAALEIAAAADKSGVDNAYHNPLHTAQVAMMTAYFCVNDRLYERDYLIALCAALGHDLGHAGKGNPKQDIIFNERIAANAVAKILGKRGAEKGAIDDVRTIILSTSPDGPHSYVKNDCAGDPPVSEQWRLVENRRLINLAKIVCDADIFVSAGINVESTNRSATLLNAEAKKAGLDIDFCCLQSRKYFLENIVGKNGFSSFVARKHANGNFESIYRQTLDALKIK